MSSEVAGKASFSGIRYAQCWEDADVLVEGLAIQPGDVCLSIASAGDNSLALLTRDPARVIALDLSAAQLACLALRVAAYRTLEHHELLELIGSRPSTQRPVLYQRCRPALEETAQRFWDAHPKLIRMGIGEAGKFERYFRLFRTVVMPLIHSRRTVDALLQPRSPEEREQFYNKRWDTWRWRMLFRIFFSRKVMGRMGRDPSFFAYVEGTVGDRILSRTRHALAELDPSANPYLHWILCGTHGDALPLALRPEHFATIRERIDRIEWRQSAIEDFLDEAGDRAIDRFNLSDIFEYMSEANTERLLARLVRAGRPGGRLAYWNMLAPRSRPDSLAAVLEPREEAAAQLHLQDKAFFYSRFVIEELRSP